MLVALLNVPKNENDWNLWAYAHREHHDEIRKAIQTQRGVNLTQYVLDPMNEDPQWLKRNAESHQDMNSALGLQGSDLDELDFQNKEQLESWIFSHYQEHFDAASALKI